MRTKYKDRKVSKYLEDEQGEYELVLHISESPDSIEIWQVTRNGVAIELPADLMLEWQIELEGEANAEEYARAEWWGEL